MTRLCEWPGEVSEGPAELLPQEHQRLVEVLRDHHQVEGGVHLLHLKIKKEEKRKEKILKKK